MALSDLTDEDLLRRAVANARSREHLKGELHHRWVGVADAFALGSTLAHELCRRFGKDPGEMVKW